MPTLGRFIQRRRLELGLTQEELAERVGDGVRQAEISRLENDRITLPRRERLERLSEALQVPIGQLLVRSGWAGADDERLTAPLIRTDEPGLSRADVEIGQQLAQNAPIVLDALIQMKALVEQVETLIDGSTALAGATEGAVRVSSAGDQNREDDLIATTGDGGPPR